MGGTVGRATPKAEFVGRLERVRSAMEDEEFDTLLSYGDTSNSANYRYFTDFRTVNGTNGVHHALLTLPKGGEPTLFVADACLGYAAETTPFEVKPFRAFSAAFRDAPPRVGLAGGGQIPARLLREVTGHFPDWTILPTEVLGRVKAVKTPWEVSRVREAARLADVGFAAAADAAGSGAVTEREIARAADSAMLSAGADAPAHITMVQSGERTAFGIALPSDREVRAGDPLLVDLAARFASHVAGGARTGSVGGGDDVVRRLVEDAHAALSAGVGQLRPGVEPAAVYDAILAELVDRGHADDVGELRGRGVGHGLGLDFEEELPWFGPHDTAALAEGMVFTLSAAIHRAGIGVRAAHTVHLGANGPEILDTHPVLTCW